VLGASIPQEGLPWKQFKNVEPEMNLKTAVVSTAMFC
jgi:hypothetical protein